MSDSIARDRAHQAYDLIARRAGNNSLIQSLSGIAGFPFTLGVDVAVIPTIYLPLWNDLRGIYQHGPINREIVVPFISRILPELLADMALDKMLGGVPLAGVYFNAICAKAMTWRLGSLIAFMSNLGSSLPVSTAEPALALIRRLFPQDQMFKFQTPDEHRFVQFVLAARGSEDQVSRRVQAALDALDLD